MKSFEQRTTFELGDVKVIVVERTEIHVYESQSENGFAVMVNKTPLAVVLEEQDGSFRRVAFS